MIPFAANSLQRIVNGEETTKLPLPLGISSPCQRRTNPRPSATCTKIGKDRACGFGDMLEDRQTDTQTHRETGVLIRILRHRCRLVFLTYEGEKDNDFQPCLHVSYNSH